MKHEEDDIKEDIIKCIEVISSPKNISENLFETYMKRLYAGLEFFKNKRKIDLVDKDNAEIDELEDLLEQNFKAKECLFDCLSILKEIIDKDRVHSSAIEDVKKLIKSIKHTIIEEQND